MASTDIRHSNNWSASTTLTQTDFCIRLTTHVGATSLYPLLSQRPFISDRGCTRNLRRDMTGTAYAKPNRRTSIE